MLRLEVDDGKGWQTLNLASPEWPDSRERLRDYQYRWQPYFGPSARFRIAKGKAGWRDLP